MANSNTIKEKFMNILFEPEEEEDEYPKRDILEEIKKDKNLRPKPSTIKATDLLYGKKDSDSSSQVFIDLNEITKEPPEVVTNEEYVASPNISPIFGNIDESKKTKKSNNSTTLNYASVDKPSSNYLGMVLSPIYGYDSNNTEDNKQEELKDVKNIDVTEDLSDIFSTEEVKLALEDDKEEKTIEVTSDKFSSFYTREDD